MAAFATTLLMTVTGACADNVPNYVNTAANHIQMNGADWSALRNKLTRLQTAGDTTVRILHIGDSHIQAETVTNRVRDILQQAYGNAGRGLMMPLRLAGTNQSQDFSVTATPGTEFYQTRLLKLPWPVKPGVTGIAVAPKSDTRLTWRATGSGHATKELDVLTSDGTRRFSYSAPMDSVTVDIPAGQAVYGAISTNGKPGLLYSAIGNNGATFNDYLLIDSYAAHTRQFQPDLIVLSMGTNEAFSPMTDAEIEWSVRELLRTLHNANPEAALLLLTPMECHTNREPGHWDRWPEYRINTRNAEVAQIIRNVAVRQHVPLWDFFTIAGGNGSSDRWIADGLMNNRDHIHLITKGYQLQGDLMGQALLEAFGYCK